MVSEMARKDTFNALVARDISERTAEILLTKYNTLKSISDAGVSELVSLGIEEAEAADVITKIGRRGSRTSSSSKASSEEVAEEIHMEPVHKSRENSDMENKLLAICEREGMALPLKIVVDIASRIENSEELSDEDIEGILKEAFKLYDRRRMDPNESVGIMAAHSIGEPGTQMNMRKFHYAGVANVNVTTGLPRLIEIVDARRVPSTPSMRIPLTGLAAEDENVAKHVSYNIEVTTLNNVADIKTDINNMRLIISPDPRKMDDRGVTVEEIYDRLNKIKVLRGLITIEGFDLIIKSDESSYKKLQQIYDSTKQAKIKGIDGISRAIIDKDKNTGAYFLVTEGSNLKEVMKVEGVDKEKVMTNSILEVADVLGIEAARNSLINEARDTLSAAGTVDIRHIMLVADMMTNDGCVKAIGRHGISGRKSSVLARAAFEITTPHLLRAAMNGEVDHLEGVAENIIVGQPVTLGTGAVNLIYTPKKSERQDKPVNEIPNMGDEE